MFFYKPKLYFNLTFSYFKCISSHQNTQKHFFLFILIFLIVLFYYEIIVLLQFIFSVLFPEGKLWDLFLIIIFLRHIYKNQLWWFRVDFYQVTLVLIQFKLFYLP